MQGLILPFSAYSKNGESGQRNALNAETVFSATSVVYALSHDVQKVCLMVHAEDHGKTVVKYDLTGSAPGNSSISA